MSTSRLFSLFVALVLVVGAVLTVRAGTATSEVESRGPDLSDYAQRHPGSVISTAKADLSDYFLRHPGSAVRADREASDWIERHLASLQAANAALARADSGASDWVERHPQVMNSGNAVDLSDYYQRHPAPVR